MKTASILIFTVAFLGCGHFHRKTNTVEITKEDASSTASSAAVTVQSNVVEQKKTVRRTARRTTTRPDGWKIEEETVEESRTDNASQAVRNDSVSASRTETKTASAVTTKNDEVLRKPRWPLVLYGGVVLVFAGGVWWLKRRWPF